MPAPEKATVRAIGQAEFATLGDRFGFFHSALEALNGDLRPADHPDAVCLGVDTEEWNGYDDKLMRLGSILQGAIIRLSVQAVCTEAGHRQTVIVPQRSFYDPLEDKGQIWYVNPEVVRRVDRHLGVSFVDKVAIAPDAEGNIAAFLCPWRVVETFLERLCFASRNGQLNPFVLALLGMRMSVYVDAEYVDVCCGDPRKVHAVKDLLATVFPSMKTLMKPGTMSKFIHKTDR